MWGDIQYQYVKLIYKHNYVLDGLSYELLTYYYVSIKQALELNFIIKRIINI